MRILVEMIDAIGVEQRCTTLDAMDDVPFSQQEFSEVGAVLAGDAGDQCGFLRHAGLLADFLTREKLTG